MCLSQISRVGQHIHSQHWTFNKTDNDSVLPHACSGQTIVVAGSYNNKQIKIWSCVHKRRNCLWRARKCPKSLKRFQIAICDLDLVRGDLHVLMNPRAILAGAWAPQSRVTHTRHVEGKGTNKQWSNLLSSFLFSWFRSSLISYCVFSVLSGLLVVLPGVSLGTRPSNHWQPFIGSIWHTQAVDGRIADSAR